MRVGITHRDDVVDGIDGDSARAEHFGFRTGDDSQWGHVAVSRPGENQDRRAGRDDNFVMNVVQRQLIIFLEKGTGTLNRADGRLFSISPATEHQNGLRKRIRHEDFIVERVVTDVVHGAAEKC